MSQNKIKVKEIKKKIKVTEIKSNSDESLEEKIEEQENQQFFSSSASSASAPIIRPDNVPVFSEQTRTQVREGLQSKDREFSYKSSNNSSRKYDSSIRSAPVFVAEQNVAGNRLNPSINQSPIREVFTGNQRIGELQDQREVEPGLRKFRRDGEEYKTERVENYVQRRRE